MIFCTILAKNEISLQQCNQKQCQSQSTQHNGTKKGTFIKISLWIIDMCLAKNWKATELLKLEKYKKIISKEEKEYIFLFVVGSRKFNILIFYNIPVSYVNFKKLSNWFLLHFIDILKVYFNSINQIVLKSEQIVSYRRIFLSIRTAI